MDEMQSQAMGEMPEYWEALIIVAHDELEIREKAQRTGVADHGVHKSVQSDLDLMFQGKSHTELNSLAAEVTGHIQNGGGGDVEYWESLMRRLKVHKAKAALRDISQGLLRQHLAKTNQAENLGHSARKVEQACRKQSNPEHTDMPPPVPVIEYEDWSPKLLSHIPEEDQDFVMTEASDLEELTLLRKMIQDKEAAHVSSIKQSDSM